MLAYDYVRTNNSTKSPNLKTDRNNKKIKAEVLHTKNQNRLLMIHKPDS